MRIQIVDDNDTNLMLFEQIALRVADDVSVECFADPVKALDDARKQLPDLVLVDYMMPVMDGHQFLGEVRKLPGGRDVPIVMITAAGERSVRQKALELGATDFLTKPVDPTEVRVRLVNLLALRRNHLRLADRNRWLADEVRKATQAIFAREHELVVRLSRAAEFRDPETGGHIQRMAHYSELIAQGLGLAPDLCDLILRAAPMHDVGKLGIPDGILLKPGRLDEQEFHVMKRHPEIGHAILDGSASQLIAMGAEIALTHHEKWDGSGYPNGLAGEAIPLTGRVVAVADVFDALTSERPYKLAWTVEKARDFLVEGKGTHFDPACVDAFVAAWDEAMVIKARFADETAYDGSVEQLA
ncbi:HD domain-containing phosphohydrolase [Magnetospirillum sp. 64-120]|uniref:HD domain-containing phosphohydrolase n=1 Tax=Magnetospirillum sp. 64-120 TaxID=1895778 RepID=UPI000926E070|nr:HD domain-containing phosphohydrolase [Magnetospirillum sp. 64-120]OJX80971.1 MAG: two-component system response regulator [Magnetospirillum sp. 64-120]